MNQPNHPTDDTSITKAPSRTLRKVVIALLCLVLCATFLLLALRIHEQEQKTPIEVFTRESIITKIQSLNRLQTIAYNIDTVIHGRKEGNWYALWQDEQKGLFLAHGRVLAGVDLNQLKQEHIHIADDGKAVEITLPSAEIFESYLDKIEVYDIQTGMFGMVSLDPELFHLAQQEGKQQIIQRACQSNILNLATENAQKQVKGLFELANVAVTVRVSNVKKCG